MLTNFKGSPFAGTDVIGGKQVTGEVPQFKNRTLELKASSPAVDAVSCQNAPPEDFNGTKRPKGGSCDIGAYEQ